MNYFTVFKIKKLQLASHPVARMHSQPPVGRQSLHDSLATR